MLPPWLRALGADVVAVRRLGDDAKALHKAITGSGADLIVTTGGTAAGPLDHVHPTLSRLGAPLLVDGVKVRPGHPMLLARTKENQHLVGLPGNPLAAISGLLTLAEPLLRILAGRVAPEPYTLPVRDGVHGHPYDTRLIPVTLHGDQAVPLRYNGPAMLRGIAAADALAVVPPGGARPGQELELLDLPWALVEAAVPAPLESGRLLESAHASGSERDRGVFHVKRPDRARTGREGRRLNRRPNWRPVTTRRRGSPGSCPRRRRHRTWHRRSVRRSRTRLR